MSHDVVAESARRIRQHREELREQELRLAIDTPPSIAMAKPAPRLRAQRALAAHLSESTIPREAPDRADGLVTDRIIAALEHAGWTAPAR